MIITAIAFVQFNISMNLAVAVEVNVWAVFGFPVSILTVTSIGEFHDF